MNKHKSNKIKENSNTVRHLIMGQITTTQNLVAIKEVRHSGQQDKVKIKIFLKLPKNSNFEILQKKLYTQHTFWSCLIRCINMKWIQPEL